MRNETLRLIRQYEPQPGDDHPTYSAVWKVEEHYIEVRVFAPAEGPGFGHVFQAQSTRGDELGRLTCMDGTELIYGTFENQAAALDYYWSFVNDPEWGLMEAIV